MRHWVEVGESHFLDIGLMLAKIVTSWLPRSSSISDKRPLFAFWSYWCMRRKVVTCGSEFCGVSASPKMWVFLRGDRHFMHVDMRPCFFLHLCTWTHTLPQASLFVPDRGRYSIRG